eukprot:gene972-198_t
MANTKKGGGGAKGTNMFLRFALAGIWIIWTAVGSTFFNNTFVHTFQDPLAHTIVRLLGAVVYGGLWAILQGVSYCIDKLKALCQPNISKRRAVRAMQKSGAAERNPEFGNEGHCGIVPSLCLVAANQFNSMALQLGGPTLPYILKSAIPVFTVVVLFVMGNRYVANVYGSLLPICVGVAVASASDVDFNPIAFVFAFISTASQVALNLTSKREMAKFGIDSSTAFLCMCLNGAIIMAPVGAHSVAVQAMLHIKGSLPFGDGMAAPITADKHWVDGKAVSSQFLMVGAAMAYWVEYALCFAMVSLVSPVEFCITDIVRRLGTILFGAYLFNKTLTTMNLIGVAVSLAGCIWYSLIEQKELPPAKKTK